MKKQVLLIDEISGDKMQNKVLDHFFLEILSGEIINLIGLEGSGKEEIYSILFGEESAESGRIWFGDKKYIRGRFLPAEKSNGIFFIGNHDLIIPDLTVAENLYIIEKINYFQLSVSSKKMEMQAEKMFRQFHIDIAPERKARELSKYECYILRLMRAYVKRARLIVVDDILDDCSFEKMSRIIEILERFKEEGISILWMNSYPDHISEIADKVSVISKGRNSLSFYKDEYDKERILECLADKKEIPKKGKISETGSSIAFQADHVNNAYFTDLSFVCKEGEILGLYDIQNKFSRELRRLLLGRRTYTGTLLVDGQVYRAGAEYELVRNHIGILDGNTYQSLIFSEMSTGENIEMAVYQKTIKWKWFINKRVEKYLDRKSAEICKDRNIGSNTSHFSRRDAMQIIYHRWQLANPKILFCFQPFLRLDAISRQQLQNLLLESKSKGTGIVISSPDISYMQALCDRILIIEDNKIVRQFQ